MFKLLGKPVAARLLFIKGHKNGVTSCLLPVIKKEGHFGSLKHSYVKKLF